MAKRIETKAENMQEEQHFFHENRFIKEEFIEGMVEHFYKQSLILIKEGQQRKEVKVILNLYTMINMDELRRIANFDCPYSIIDKYRDEILVRLQDRLVKNGFLVYRLYDVDKYLPSALTVACVAMDEKQIVRLSNAFVHEKNVTAAVSIFLVSFLLFLVFGGTYLFELNNALADVKVQLVAVGIEVVLIVTGLCVLFFQKIIASFTEKGLRSKMAKVEKQIIKEMIQQEKADAKKEAELKGQES